MNRMTQIINEEISAITKDKNKEIFNYKPIIDVAWRDIVKSGMKFQKISFDLENDDTTGQKKTFHVKKNLRKDQPIKYTFNAELFEAGGDWEMPVMYFKLEFTRDYFHGNKRFKSNLEFVWDLDKNKGEQLNKCYIIIPPVEAGNKLVKNDSKGKDKPEWLAYQNDGLSKEQEKEARITKQNKIDCWLWLKDLLSKLVDDRHEQLD